jgi:hypothetical protein
MSMTMRTTIRWTDDEFAEVRQYADRRSISLSAVIREANGRRQTPQRDFIRIDQTAGDLGG